MIHKNATFGQTKNIMVCEMGTGDVWMLGSEKGENGETVLAMRTVAEPRPINVIEKASVETFDEMQPELVFIFNKVESIDSFINMLRDCKAEMVKPTLNEDKL
jgi:hypothetical protein